MYLKTSKRMTVVLAAVAVTSVLGLAAMVYTEGPLTEEELAKDPEAVLEGYRHVEAASVSDAVEQVLHVKPYLSHTMQPIFQTKFAGRALTVLLKKEENTDPHALDGMLSAIDSGSKGDVYVMKIEDGADIAGMGGLMGTAMWSRGFVGAVVDGGVRDLPQLKRIGFPVYSTGAVPSTSVGHYRFGGLNQAVEIAGRMVHAGDIITADQDGVVVVPKEHAVEVLVRARKLDETEHAMYPYIERLHSIVAAVKAFGRI